MVVVSPQIMRQFLVLLSVSKSPLRLQQIIFDHFSNPISCVKVFDTYDTTNRSARKTGQGLRGGGWSSRSADYHPVRGFRAERLRSSGRFALENQPTQKSAGKENRNHLGRKDHGELPLKPGLPASREELHWPLEIWGIAVLPASEGTWRNCSSGFTGACGRGEGKRGGRVPTAITALCWRLLAPGNHSPENSRQATAQGA